ncbi:MAG: UDP-2-acetamido-3-amino-2,3-dideoxy-glucuronate N-acetyltransferase [Myxococcota bacterium]|jgi:UDP-2-acetamido-3-amino-2,3-dideoxy-glucuronate N-acetyltransferase
MANLDPSHIHASAVVDSGALIGARTRVWHFCHVMSGATIGDDCILGQNVFVASGVTVGNRVKIQNNVSVYNGVELDDDVFCGPSMVFTNVRNPRSHVERKHAFAPTRVGRGATLGANCTVVCGNNVGSFSMVAAGAVVTSDVPPYALVMGVPAKIAGWMCQCGERLGIGAQPESGSATCEDCSRSYTTDESGVMPI